MNHSGALFTSAIGPCGVAWGDAGIVGVQLPEADRAATERRLRRRFPTVQLSHLPADVLQATTAMARLLAGEKVDFSFVVLDFGDVSVFHQRVWNFARTIPDRKSVV